MSQPATHGNRAATRSTHPMIRQAWPTGPGQSRAEQRNAERELDFQSAPLSADKPCAVRSKEMDDSNLEPLVQRSAIGCARCQTPTRATPRRLLQACSVLRSRRRTPRQAGLNAAPAPRGGGKKEAAERRGRQSAPADRGPRRPRVPSSKHDSARRRRGSPVACDNNIDTGTMPAPDIAPQRPPKVASLRDGERVDFSRAWASYGG